MKKWSEDTFNHKKKKRDKQSLNFERTTSVRAWVFMTMPELKSLSGKIEIDEAMFGNRRSGNMAGMHQVKIWSLEFTKETKRT